MDMIQSWKLSLMPFGGKTLKPFLFEILKTIAATSRTLISSSWVLVGLFLLVEPFISLGLLPYGISKLISFELAKLVASLIAAILFYRVIFVARTSVKPQQNLSFWRILYLVFSVIMTVALMILLFKHFNVYFPSVRIYTEMLVFSVYSYLYLFFLSDSKGRIYDLFISLWQSLKGVLWCLPGVLVISALCYGADLLIRFVLRLVKSFILTFNNGALWVPLSLHFFNNLYKLAFVLIVASVAVVFYMKRLRESQG